MERRGQSRVRLLRVGHSALLLLLIVLTGCIITKGGGQSRGPDEVGGGEVPRGIVETTGGGRIVLVPVFVRDDGPFTFALDTGASHSVIDLDLVRDLGRQPEARQRVSRRPRRTRPIAAAGTAAHGPARSARLETARGPGHRDPAPTAGRLEPGGSGPVVLRPAGAHRS